MDVAPQPRRRLARVRLNKHSSVHLYSAEEHRGKLGDPRESVTDTNVRFRGANPPVVELNHHLAADPPTAERRQINR